MNKVFLDTDVILDFLLDRDPYISEITEIIEKSVAGEMSLCVSSLTISNLHYIISQIENKRSANSKTRKILKLLKVENVGQTTVIKAMESEFGDFEDGIQNYCAEEADHKILVTRNIKDYKKSKLAIMTPRAFTICDVLNIIFDILIVGYSVFSLGIAWEKHLNLDRYEF